MCTGRQTGDTDGRYRCAGSVPCWLATSRMKLTPASRLGKISEPYFCRGGSLRSRSTASVITPSEPSDPSTICCTSGPIEHRGTSTARSIVPCSSTHLVIWERSSTHELEVGAWGLEVVQVQPRAPGQTRVIRDGGSIHAHWLEGYDNAIGPESSFLYTHGTPRVFCTRF